HSGVAAIILAAGKSSRFGGPKQLAILGHRTLLERTLDIVRRSSEIEQIILVLGHSADEIIHRINTGGAKVVINAHYARGLSSSLRAGLQAAVPDSEIQAVLIVLADQPFLQTSTIN